MPQRPKKKSSFDKTVSQYERKLERQRQMEKFEKVAAEDVPDDAGMIASFFPTSDTGKKKPDPDGANAPPKGAIENARKFLWDEDDEDYEVPSGGSRPQKNPNQYGGMNDSASSRASMFFAKTGIEQDSRRLKDIRGFESPGLADNMHDVNLNSSFRFRGSGVKRNNGICAPIGACFSGCFAPCACSRTQKILWAAAFICLALGVAGAVIGVTVGFSFGSSSDGDGATQTSSPGGPDAEKEEFPLGHDRYVDIREYILNSGFTDEGDLDDESSAQSKALWWIAVDDQAQVEIGDCQLLQRYALATFFFSTFVGEVDNDGGMELTPDWDNNRHWMTEAEICKWHGIQCVESEAVSKTGIEPINDFHVVQLNLAANSVKGSIPPEIAALEMLKMLNLSENELQGDIPESLGTLKHLAVLELQGNQLKGNIPPALGECKSLRNLHLDNNDLSGPIPPELGQLAHLKKFDAGYNQLDGPIPHTIKGWKSMIDFRINNNQITGKIPFQVSHVPNLEILHIQDNQMTGAVPHAISKLSKLRT